jgi:hypothetical protein
MRSCTLHNERASITGKVLILSRDWNTVRVFFSCVPVDMIVGLGPLLLLAAPLLTVSLAFIPPPFSASRESSNHSQGSSSFQSRCLKSSSAFLFTCPTSPPLIHMHHKGRYKIDSILYHWGWNLNIWEGDLWIPIHLIISQGRERFLCEGQMGQFRMDFRL